VISTLLGLLVGALVGALCWATAATSFDVEALRRTNYRGAPLVTGIGALVPLTVLFVSASARVFVAGGGTTAHVEQLVATTLAASLGFGLLGLVDDVAGEGQSGGFRGHLASMRHGVLSSGMIKLLGGAAVGVLTVASMRDGTGTPVALLRDGATIALCANLGNLFDRAPGRVTKVTTVSFVVLAVLAWDPALFLPGVAIGAGLGLIVPDLRERAMLGDVGANVLGSMCGIAALSAFAGSISRWVLLAVVAALNLLSEIVSFSRVIDSVAPLRWLDRLGSLREVRDAP